MKINPHAAAAAVTAAPKTNTDTELNPAQQARAADPTAKGAAFGHLVASFAHAKHAPAPPVLSPPVTDPVEETPPAGETPPTDEAPPVDETPPAAETPPVEETPPTETAGETAPATDPATSIETQLLANLVVDTEPGDLFDIVT